MPLFTHRATMAGLRRIHGYTRAELKGLGVAVEGVRTDGFHHSAKFVPENERLLHQYLPNAGIFVGVEVAAANTGCRDANECLSRFG